MSKRSLTDDDLATDWFLLPAERCLLANKSRTTHVGFSILLKYFQLEGRFPASPKEIPSSAVQYVAYQLDSTAEDWSVYVRVSSADQNTDRQLDGIELDNIFTDKVSGKSTDRPQLQELLRHLRKGDHLFVHSMDRLARNLMDLRQLVQDLTARGVKVQFVKEGLTFTGDEGAMSILMLSIMGAVAEFERSIIRERQAEGIKIAKTKGVYKGRKASLTYDQIEEVKLKVAAGIPKTKIAKEYKCNRETIYRYLRHKS